MGQKQSKREAPQSRAPSPKQPKPRIINSSTESPILLDPSLLPWNQAIHPFDSKAFVHKYQPLLCDACINLATVFSDPSLTRRGLVKASVSNIAHHHSLVSLFESSRICPLCSLIVVAVPGLTECLCGDIVKDIVQIEFSPRYESFSYSEFDLLLGEWTENLGNTEGGLNSGRFLDWEDKYASQVLRLGVHGAAPPLGEVIRALSGDLTKRFHTVDPWSLYIRERYAIKGQISELAISQESTGAYSGLKDPPSGNLRVYSHSDKFTARLVSGRPVSSQDISLKTLQLAKSWVDFCFDNHSECQWSSGSGDPCLPTRAIDVATLDNDSVRLISSQGMCGKWAALSHRWGVKPFFTLREDTIQSLKTGIPVASLPTTFQDAIKLTRFLGLKYLWIDSLCILQDSVADWAAEAATMPRVYQNAYVTIAAAATEDSHGGIFVEKAWANVTMPCALPVKSRNDRGTVTIDLPLDYGLEHEEINYLNKRAWCFQEARLSHRLLTFDRLQMSYTCLKHGLLESRDLPEGAAREEKNPFLPRLHSASGKDDQTKNRELLSTCRHCLNGTYCRGLYERRIFRWPIPPTSTPGTALVAIRRRNIPQSPHKSSLSSSYRAPSWSWASIESPISNFLCRQALGRKTHAQILEITTTLQGLDPYGQVKAGSLNIRAPLQEVMCGEASSRWPYQPNLLPLDYPSLSMPSIFEEESKLGHAIFDLDWAEKGSRAFLLQITDAYGLILIPITVGDREVYSRIGVCHFGSNVKLKNITLIEIM
ncbi:uncharacterized protein PAC_18192 [Phialocephala subalpina]|uniref:Heterokaryon incompatibility domain-containing protein n=1 Tax=Phialocephala subalpina TaxID=576137 RepID=A0A1L7XTD4_9HELO|nr:uncharacterized protein PAC_18192 [Phialocephala subalpina]